MTLWHRLAALAVVLSATAWLAWVILTILIGPIDTSPRGGP